MKRVTWLKIAAVGAAALLVACEYPSEPIVDPNPPIPPLSAVGTLYAINSPYQVCNPSVSQDTGMLKGCMLWLGFAELNVTVKPQDAAVYTLSGVMLHDRLTVTDTANQVEWFLMRDSVPGITGELQDPEWSTDPDHIAFLGKDASRSWDGFVVRVSDKRILKFNESGLFETSTPHVWVGDPSGPPAASGTGYQADGWAPHDSIYAHFNTINVKIAYSVRVGVRQDLYYVDYSCDSCDTVIPVRMQKPQDRPEHRVESALFSPSGEFVTYNCFIGDPNDPSTVFESYVQRLGDATPARLVASPAAEPHWFMFGGRSYIVYSTQGGFHQEDLMAIPEGSAGETMLQEVVLSAEGPLYLQFALVGEPRVVLRYPFKGGISPDGYYAATGYSRAYLFRFF